MLKADDILKLNEEENIENCMGYALDLENNQIKFYLSCKIFRKTGKILHIKLKLNI